MIKGVANNNLNIGFFIIMGILAIILIIFIRRKIKVLKIPCVYLITGAPKTGKTALAVWLVRWNIFKLTIGWHVGKFFYWVIHHTCLGYRLKPMVYSNIPVAFKHNPLTKDILLRKVRIPDKSIVLIDEASLVADSMMFKDKNINDQLLLFAKLFGHYSHGGQLYLTSHTTTDLHYAFKRALGQYLYIYTTISTIPFFCVCKCRDMVYSDSTNVVNDINEDTELSCRTIIYPKFVFKLYDCFCYSCFTDNLAYQVDYEYTYSKKELKAKKIVSFNRDFENLEVVNNEDI